MSELLRSLSKTTRCWAHTVCGCVVPCSPDVRDGQRVECPDHGWVKVERVREASR